MKTVTSVMAVGDEVEAFTCMIDGIPIPLQIDISCYYMILGGDIWPTLGKPKLHQAGHELKVLADHNIPLTGEWSVKASAAEGTQELQALFIDHKGINLLGREWIRRLTPDLNAMFVQKDHVPELSTAL